MNLTPTRESTRLADVFLGLAATIGFFGGRGGLCVTHQPTLNRLLYSKYLK